MATEGYVADSHSVFPPTQWSLVLAAGGSRTAEASQALEELCRTYWFPIYTFARKSGSSVADAQDLTQGFFQRLIEDGTITRADASLGRFRSFLLGAFLHHCRNQHRHDAAAKRGGGRAILSLDAEEAESRYVRQAASSETPDRSFDRQWALAVLDQALKRLEAEFADRGRRSTLQQLLPFLQIDGEGASYSDAARALGTTEATIRVTVHRLRQRYRELLHAVVLQTVSSPLDVEAELRDLAAVLRR